MKCFSLAFIYAFICGCWNVPCISTFLMRAIYYQSSDIPKGRLPMEHGQSAKRLTRLVHFQSLLKFRIQSGNRRIIWTIEHNPDRIQLLESYTFWFLVLDNFPCLIRYKSLWPCTDCSQLYFIPCSYLLGASWNDIPIAYNFCMGMHSKIRNLCTKVS